MALPDEITADTELPEIGDPPAQPVYTDPDLTISEITPSQREWLDSIVNERWQVAAIVKGYEDAEASEVTLLLETENGEPISMTIQPPDTAENQAERERRTAEAQAVHAAAMESWQQEYAEWEVLRNAYSKRAGIRASIEQDRLEAEHAARLAAEEEERQAAFKQAVADEVARQLADAKAAAEIVRD